MKKIRLLWSVHPGKARGLYRATETSVELIDKSYHYEPDYPFIRDGKVRSRWYDLQCKRRTGREVKQEIDVDVMGGNSEFFDTPTLMELERETVLPPELVGELEFDIDTKRAVHDPFIIGGDKCLKLWIKLADGRPPSDRLYFFGIDIGTGAGRSNSVISIGDDKTPGIKIGEYANPFVGPEDFADLACAMGWWFVGPDKVPARMIWETNGPGGQFGRRVIDNGYRNLYYKTAETSLGRKVSDIPGWGSTKENKKVLLGDYRRALGSREFLNPSAEALRECREYIFSVGGRIEHCRALKTVDAAESGDNHGDRVIGDALLNKVIKSYIAKPEPPAPPKEEKNTFARRLERYNEKRKAVSYW